MKVIVDWCNTNQGFVMALLTLVYVAATVWLVLLAKKQLKLAVDLERGRTRPFVIFDLISEDHFVFARVSNIGQSAAREIQIKILPEIKARLGGKNAVPAEERSKDIPFLERGVAMMPPGRSIKALVAHWRPFSEHYENLRFEGTVTYESSDGIKYVEPVVIDLAAEAGILFLGRKDIDDVAKRLEDISKTLDKVASGYNKPLVRTISEQEHQRQELARFTEISAFGSQTTDGLNENARDIYP